MSFWKDTPNVSYWDFIKEIWSFSQASPPKLLEATKEQKEKIQSQNNQKKPGWYVQRVKMKDTEDSYHLSKEISTFITKSFNKSNSTVTTKIPPAVIANWFSTGSAIAVEARDSSHNLIGVAISRRLEYFYLNELPESPLKEVGLVDYFCVDRVWREKGVGTALLFKLHTETAAEGRVAHIFISEGQRLFSRIPPFVQSQYKWRECLKRLPQMDIQVKYNIVITKDLIESIGNGLKERHKQLSRESIIPPLPRIYFTAFTSSNNTKTELSYYSYKDNMDASISADILIRPTYEEKEGKPVGEVVAFWGNSKYLDIMLDHIGNIHMFGVFLAPQNFPESRRGWHKGGHYAYYSFHFHPGEYMAGAEMLLLI